MCGIAGYVLPDGLGRRAIEEALEALRHRGPNDYGIYCDAEVFLGVRRLSIIDLEGGKQPITNEDRSLIVVLNGEIYNYRELRARLRARGHLFQTESDTEVLVHGYEEWGEQVVEELRGMFAFALWDCRKHELFLARDRLGKKPLYYCCPRPGSIAFASEIKGLRPLAASAGQRWTISSQSIYDYLSLAVVPQPQTVFSEVCAFPAASCGIFSKGALKTRLYWDLDNVRKSRGVPSQRTYAEALEEVRHLVREAVRLRLRSDVPLGVFLSGGVDSSVVAYEAAQEVGESLQTFSVAVQDQRLNEAPIAERTARRLGVHNTVIELDLNPLNILDKLVSHLDQPFADASAIPTYAVARKASEFVRVILNGDGGDELFGGYRRYVAARLFDRFPQLAIASALRADALLDMVVPNRRNLAGFASRLFRGLRQSPGQRYLTWTTDALTDPEKRRLWRGPRTQPTEAWIEQLMQKDLSALQTQMRADQKILLLSGLLVKMDMATMLASVEARSPLLDHKVAETASTLPDHFLVNGTRSKVLLRDAYRGVLPDEILTAKKRGFEIPLQRWLATDLREMTNDLLGAHDARIQEYIDPRFTRELLDHRSLRERNRSYILYAFLVLELWLRSLRNSMASPRMDLAA